MARAIVPLEEVKKYPKYCGEMVGLQGWIPFFSPKDMNQPAQGCLNIRIAFDVGPSKEFNSRYDAFKSVAPWPLPEEKDSFSLFVGTWNLGNAPPSNDLSDWVIFSGSLEISFCFDAWPRFVGCFVVLCVGSC